LSIRLEGAQKKKTSNQDKQYFNVLPLKIKINAKKVHDEQIATLSIKTRFTKGYTSRGWQVAGPRCWSQAS
jgi:hypothetical protein